LAVNPEKEKLVVRLHSESKSYREIAKIARISVRDIKPILHKYGANNVYGCTDIDYHIEDTAAAAVLPNSTKAYKLFSEGKTPLQVSIALNLRAPEVKTLYLEYWELRRMRMLAKTYDEIGDEGISSLLQLHRSCKAQQISNLQIVEYLGIYGNDLASVKHEYDEIDVSLQGLLSQKYRTEKELQDLNASIGYSFDMLKSMQAQCAEAERQRNELLKQKVRLHIFVSQFKNNKGMYLKVVEERVNTILRNSIKLLELSLIAALKTFRNDPNIYRYLHQKSELSAAQFQRPNTTLLVPANNNPVDHSYNYGLKHHTVMQKPGDFCYACYDVSYRAEGISRMYYKNLGKEMIREIGLNSFEELFNAASNHPHQHY
jgi:hypothetical protein